MTTHTEGTIILDGLIEGTFPKDAERAERLLRDWVGFAAGLGLRFSLEVEGRAWSLLADNRPFVGEKLGADPHEAIKQALKQLISIFPPEERKRLFSTLRATAYRKGLEVRTLYLISPDGSLTTEEQSAEVPTKPAPEPLSPRHKALVVLGGVALLAILLAISSLFIDYRELFRRAGAALRPIDLEKLQVDLSAFEGYLELQKKSLDRLRGVLVLTVTRGPRFPREPAQAEALAKQATTMAQRLALEAIVRGYVRVELFDAEGKFLQFTFVRIRGLATKPTVAIRLPLAPLNPRRVVLTY